MVNRQPSVDSVSLNPDTQSRLVALNGLLSPVTSRVDQGATSSSHV